MVMYEEPLLTIPHADFSNDQSVTVNSPLLGHQNDVKTLKRLKNYGLFVGEAVRSGRMVNVQRVASTDGKGGLFFS